MHVHDHHPDAFCMPGFVRLDDRKGQTLMVHDVQLSGKRVSTGFVYDPQTAVRVPVRMLGNVWLADSLLTSLQNDAS